MTGKSDTELVKKIQKINCNESLIELIKRHELLFMSVCQKYASVFNLVGVNLEDVINERYFIIFRAATKFNFKIKKMKISSWIGQYARYHCLNTINDKKRSLPIIDNLLISKEIATASPEDNKYLLDYAFSTLSNFKDDRILKVFKLRYADDQKVPWRKVSKAMNMTNQTCINLHNKGINLLKFKFKGKNLVNLI